LRQKNKFLKNFWLSLEDKEFVQPGVSIMVHCDYVAAENLILSISENIENKVS